MRSFCASWLTLAAAGLLVVGPGCQRPAAGGRERLAPAHWTYRGKTGPRHWGSLGAANALCGRGRAQSPVDLGTAAAGEAGPVALRYRPVSVTASDTGHTIQWDFAQGASIVIDGLDYPLLQAHFHAPAEHPSSGVRQALEFHFVHQAADGRRAVLAVIGREGRPHPEVGRLLAAMAGDGGGSGATISPEALLPEGRAAVRYQGSLTTPPCSENVSWIVLTEPVQLARDQLDRLRAWHSGNYRPAQPLNDRRPVLAPVRSFGG